MRAIIVARVSTEEQKEAGLSLPAQVVRLEKYCQNKGFSILKTFSFDESAYKNDRQEFDGILDFLLGLKEKTVVCFDKVDRLSRNNFDKRVSDLYDKALKDEIELHFVSDNQIINSRISAAEKFQFSITLGLARYYSDAISDNVHRANEQKWRNGEWTSKAPLGYKNITLPGDRKDVIVDEHAAYIIKRAFELYGTGAFSMNLLRKRMKEECGVEWSKSYVDKILENHFYYGVMCIKGNSYPHKYPPIITKELFDQVQKVKDGFNKRPVKYAGKPFLYRGLIRCAHCGLAITASEKKGHVYYYCTQYNGKHNAKYLREEEITRQLGNVFQRLQMPDAILKEAVEALNRVHENKVAFHNRHYDELTKRQKELTRMMDNLLNEKLRDRITDEQYDRFYKNFSDEMEDVKLRLSNLQTSQENYYVTMKYLLLLSQKAYELFIGSKVEEKRQLIKLVLGNLRLSDENLVYDVQKPFNLIANCWDSQLWRP